MSLLRLGKEKAPEKMFLMLQAELATNYSTYCTSRAPSPLAPGQLIRGRRHLASLPIGTQRPARSCVRSRRNGCEFPERRFQPEEMCSSPPLPCELRWTRVFFSFPRSATAPTHLLTHSRCITCLGIIPCGCLFLPSPSQPRFQKQDDFAKRQGDR